MTAHWASKLGLARTPLFSRSAPEPGTHVLLLDGVHGSFGLSEVERADTRPEPRNWAWSSGVLHHVTATPDKIHVQRWDKSEVVSYQTAVVEDQLTRFYGALHQAQVSISKTVTEHSIDAYKRLRAKFQNADRDYGLDVYLFLMASMLNGRDSDLLDGADELVARYDLPQSCVEALSELSPDFVQHLIAAFRTPLLPRGIDIMTWPDLLMRHAGAMVFQEAHFETTLRGSVDIFGVPSAAVLSRESSNGVHYTPPGLARSLAEQALDAIGELPDALTILDPACGSASILHELLRILNDRGYRGRLTILGYDQSPSAVQMSRFFLAVSRQDWLDLNIIEITVTQRDALSEEPWPRCDLVIMNPPFISLRSLSKDQRETITRILGAYDRGRPDLAMAFVERAVQNLTETGVVASLLPAGILSMVAGKAWRAHLLERVSVTLLAAFGEVNLFRMATVEVAALVLRAGQAQPQETYKALWVGEKRDATSDALRYLRRNRRHVVADREIDRWSLDALPLASLAASPTWRPRPRFLQNELVRSFQATGTTLADIVRVHQGALPAPREAFIISAKAYAALPEAEHCWFRRIAENKNIRSGQIIPGEYIFYSKSAGLPELLNEADFAQACPNFYRYLKAFQPQLMKGRESSGRWWELRRERGYLKSPILKIVTAYFGQAGAFAVDSDGDHVIVQGYGWLPAWKGRLPDGITVEAILHAYVAIVNTVVFQQILSEFCPAVGGGQFNLSKRFVDRVPLPDLPERARQADGDDQVLSDLISIGMSIQRRGTTYSPMDLAEDLTRTLYGLR